MKFIVKAQNGKLTINCECDRLTDAAVLAQLWGGKIFCRKVKEKTAHHCSGETV